MKRLSTVKTKSDTVTEDNEYFWFDVFETKADAEEYNYAAWDKGYISNDAGSVTAGATYSYTVTGANNSTGMFNGEEITKQAASLSKALEIETNIDSGTIGSNSSKNNTSTTKLPSPTTADTDKFFA